MSNLEGIVQDDRVSRDTVRVRPARVDDVDAMLALEALFPSDQLNRRGLRRLLRSASARLWVAEARVEGQPQVLGDLILLLPARWRSARIYSVVVAPAARGRGVGRALVTTAEAAARAAGRQALRLEVRADNGPARALYQQLGFVCVAAKPGYYDDGADGEAWVKSWAAAD